MKGKKKLAVLFMAAFLALSLGVFAACAEEEHSLTYVGEVAATCTDAGHEAYYLCSHCGKLFADENAETELSDADVTIAALGHDMTHHEAVEAGCTVDGNIEYWSCSRCNLNFSDEAGTKEVASVTLPAGHDIEWVNAVEPTVSAEGMRAHYECSKCNTCYEDIDGKEVIDREDLVLAQLIEQQVSVTVEVYDTAGNKVESPDFAAISGELSLLGAYSANQYTGLAVASNGTLELDSIIVGEYTVELYGYRRSTFTVIQGTSDYTLALYATIAYGSNDKVTVDDTTASVTIKGSVADYQNTAWSGSAELVLSEDIAGSTGVVLEFNAKNITNSQASGNDEWASQRIAVQMARGYEGFLFFLPSNEANIFDLTDGGIRDEGKTRFGADGHTYDWINTLMRGESGVNMRLVRTGANVTLFVQNAEAEWVKIGTIACADATTDIIIYGCGVEWKFSSVKADKLTYVPAKEATAEEPGNYAYYTDGTNYWFEDGEQTTEDGVKLYVPVEVTLTVNGIALDGETSETVAEGTEITFTSRAATYTYTVGGEAIDEMVAGSYTVTADGYRTTEINVPVSGGTVELTLTKVITIGKGATVLVGNAWNGQQELPVPEDLSENFLMEFTLKMSDFTQGFNDLGAWQRYAIRLTEGNTGFYFWSWDDGTAKTRIRQFSVENRTNAAKENADVNGDEEGIGFITNELLDTDGLQLRILRAGNTFYLYALNGEEWVKLGSVTCAEGDKIDMEVYAGVGTYEWSNVNFTEVTHVPEKEPVSADEPGNIEYYTDGENYWLPDGTATTLEDTVVKYEVAVTVIAEGIALDGETSEAVAEGTVITFTSRAATYTYTVGGEAIDEMVAGSYTVTADGYRTTEINVPVSGGTVELTLTKVITIGKGATVLVGNAWNGQQELPVPEDLSENFLMEFTLKMSDFTQGFNDLGAWQRYAIRLTEGNTGFYFWSWDDGTAKTRIRQFSVENRTNAAKENADVNGDEEGIGFITNELLDTDGLQLRILRAGNTFYLYALNGEEWVKLGSVTCAEGDKIDMEVYAGVGTYEWSNVNFTEVTHVPEKEPVSADEPGNIEYYTDGENYWLPDGTATTLEDTVVKYEVAVTVIAEGIALDGETSEAVAEGTVITFTSRAATYTYTVGEEAPAEMVAGDYTVTADGYRTTEINVPVSGGTVEITLTKVISIEGDVADYDATRWSDSVALDISEELKASTAVILEFNVRNVTNSQASGNSEWASQRIAIQMAEGNEGFLFFLPKGEANIFDMTDSSIRDEGKTRFGESGSALSWIDTLMRGASGVNMRLVRTGENVTLFVQNAEAEWVKIGTVACGSAATEIVFYGCGVEWEFSSVTAEEITYVPDKEPVSTDEPGNIEYYTDGTNYWLPDGTVTTPEETVVKYEVEVTLTLEGVALDGETPEAVAEGTVLTFTSARSVYTYTVGQGEAFRLSPDTYTVTANGYKTASLTVTEGTTEYTLTLYRTIAYASNDKVTVDDKNGTINVKGDVADYTSDQWSGSAELALSDEVKQSTNVTLEFTVRNVTNSQSGWPENEWASQRLAIQMAQGYEGFMFFLPRGEANIFDMTDGGIADSGKTRFGESGSALSWIDTLMRSENGINMRIVREGANVTLLVQNAEEAWIEIGTVTCASADAATEIVFYGCGVEWEFSSITVTPNVQE